MLDVNPELTRRGIGTVDVGGARRVSLVDMRVVRSPAKLAPYKRFLIIADRLQKITDAFKPDVVTVKRVPAQSNIGSVTSTAQVTGIIMLAVAKAGLRLAMHTPSEVKAVVTKNGCADKRQMQVVVQRILGLASLPRPADVADAVAIAIVHSWHGDALSDEEPDRT